MPNRFASLFPEVYRAILRAERYVEFRFSRTERIVCIVGSFCRRLSFLAFRIAFRLYYAANNSLVSQTRSVIPAAIAGVTRNDECTRTKL